MGYLGYVECDGCLNYVHIEHPSSITIWFHPDDSNPLAEVVCPKCGVVTTTRVTYMHMANFRSYGVKILPLSDKFEPLTEEAIDEWDIDAELASI